MTAGEVALARVAGVRRRRHRAIAGLVVAASIGASLVALAEPTPPLGVVPVEVSARRIGHFQISNPQRTRFGKLEFLGGVVMSATPSGFGGWSGIVMDPDGRHFLAVSDEGSWMSGEIAYEGRRPVGIARAKLGPIRALRGRTLDKKRDLDAEAVNLASGTLAKGTVLVGFERNHRIGVFPVERGEISAPVRYLKLPAEARRMRSNKGFEAVAVLKGGPSKGSTIAFAERYPGSTAEHVGWLWTGEEPKRIGLVDIGAFEVTDAVSLDNGDLLVLERRFRWTEGVKMRLRRIAAADIKPGAVLQGEVLLEADMSFEIDNMEGLAVHQGAGGETVLTLISDNNFSGILQRNLLLQFAISDERRAVRGR
jgi:hypothetical protein